MNHLSFTIFILCLTSITGNQVTPTQSYSLLEDDIVIYDDDEIFEGEFLEAEVRHWPKTGNEVLIPYVKKTILSDRIKEKALKRAISEFNTNTCIRFVERQKNETDYLEIDLDSLKCASVVGRKGGKQKVRIGGCIDKQDKFSYGMVIHELMHSIGFTHEHSRTDRNAFIEIDYDAIRKVEEDDFVPNGTYARKFLRCNETELGRRFSCKLINSYDKASIMHYSNRIGSINAREVFKSKQPCPNNDCKFGQRKYLSPMDIKDIEDAYGCVKPTEMSVIMKAFQQLKGCEVNEIETTWNQVQWNKLRFEAPAKTFDWKVEIKYDTAPSKLVTRQGREEKCKNDTNICEFKPRNNRRLKAGQLLHFDYRIEFPKKSDVPEIVSLKFLYCDARKCKKGKATKRWKELALCSREEETEAPTTPAETTVEVTD